MIPNWRGVARAQRLLYRQCRLRHRDDFGHRNRRRRALSASRRQELFDEFTLALVLRDLLNARLSAQGDRQAPEIVELNDASRGEGLQIFLGDALIAERSVDDRSGRAVGEADENRNGVRVVAGGDCLGLDRKAPTKERQGVHEMTDFANDASAAFVTLDPAVAGDRTSIDSIEHDQRAAARLQRFLRLDQQRRATSIESDGQNSCRLMRGRDHLGEAFSVYRQRLFTKNMFAGP